MFVNEEMKCVGRKRVFFFARLGDDKEVIVCLLKLLC